MENIDPGFTAAQLAIVNNSAALIAQRDEEIQKIVEAIAELAQIMRDLSVLVIEQGTVLDRIDYNITQTAAKVWMDGRGQGFPATTGIHVCTCAHRRACVHGCVWTWASRARCQSVRMAAVASWPACDEALPTTRTHAYHACERPHACVRVHAQVEEGVVQLQKAESTQKRGRMFLCIIALIVLIVVMLIIVIIRHA